MNCVMCKPETIGLIADIIWSYAEDPELYELNGDKSEGSLFAPKLNGDDVTRDDIYQRLWNMNFHYVTKGYTDHATTMLSDQYTVYPALPPRNDLGVVAKFEYYLDNCRGANVPNSLTYKQVNNIMWLFIYEYIYEQKEYKEEPRE